MTNRYEELLLPEQRDRIVGKVITALKTQGQLTASTLNDFRDLFRAGKPIPGFNKDPLRAVPPLLKQHLLERLDENPDLDGLIASVWAESQQDLREAVTDHIRGIDESFLTADDVDEEFWDVQVALLAEEHGDYEEDDILLMTKLCYAQAKSQAAGEAGDTAPERPDGQYGHMMDGDLAAVLETLRAMPSASPQWRDAIPRFVEAVEDLIKEKNQELVRVRGVTTALIHIQSVFQSELSFFTEQEVEWDAPKLAALMAATHGVDQAAEALSELKDALTIYREIKEIADTIVEERKRRGRRHEVEVVIEGKLSEIDEVSRTASMPEKTELNGGETPANETDSIAKLSPEENAELIEELRTLRQEHDATTANSLELQGEVTGLRADKKALTEEVAELRDQLRISETNATNWRAAYEAGMRSEDSSAPEPIPEEFASVREAWELAKARLGDRLAFRPNKKSEIDYNYRRPREVWDALEWLATTYHDSQTGESRVMDLNESIRNACSGWEYRPNQTDITLNTFREWYETTKDGKTFELREHLAKGTGRDANVIRIAFAWDEDSERVIVGYIGPHQRSRSS